MIPPNTVTTRHELHHQRNTERVIKRKNGMFVYLSPYITLLESTNDASTFMLPIIHYLFSSCF